MGDNGAMKEHRGKDCLKQTNEGNFNSIISLLSFLYKMCPKLWHLKTHYNLKENSLIVGD